jgi:hypothetical protein
LLVPVTDAVKVADALALRFMEAGATVIPTGVKYTVAVAVLVESVRAVAVTATLCSVAMTPGAW